MTERLARYGEPAVEDMILSVRRQKVILDADLARIYGVTTKALNQAVVSRSLLRRFNQEEETLSLILSLKTYQAPRRRRLFEFVR